MSPKRNTSIGPMSARSANVPHWTPPKFDFSDLPARVTNSSSRAPLRMSEIWTSAARPGSLVAFSLPSRGWA